MRRFDMPAISTVVIVFQRLYSVDSGCKFSRAATSAVTADSERNIIDIAYVK